MTTLPRQQNDLTGLLKGILEMQATKELPDLTQAPYLSNDPNRELSPMEILHNNLNSGVSQKATLLDQILQRMSETDSQATMTPDSVNASSMLDSIDPKAPPAGVAVATGGNRSRQALHFKELLDLIGEGESKGNYNAVWGGVDEKLTSKTVDEVLKDQAKRKLSASGKYQIIRENLLELKDKMGLKGDELFNESLQDKMAVELLKKRGVADFLSGDMTIPEFKKKLAAEWAALPKDMSGKSAYEGDGLNKAQIDPNDLIDILKRIQVAGK